MRKRRGAKNGFYPRDIEGFFGAVEDIKIPRTGEGGFKPFFIRPYRKASYEIEDLVIAMYQGGCSTRDVTRTMEILLGHRYSASWVSRMTDVIHEKVADFRHRKIELWLDCTPMIGQIGLGESGGVSCYPPD